MFIAPYWADLDLREIDANVFGNIGSTFGQTRIRPSGGTRSGVMMVATEYHTTEGAPGRTGSAAFNVHHEGTRAGQDVITIPGDQIQF